MHNFTTEDLLLYLYKETSPKRTAQIIDALEKDWSLREKMEVIESAQKKLGSLKMSPSEKTMENILSYADKAVTELTPHA